jgi:hypothetical protein
MIDLLVVVVQISIGCVMVRCLNELWHFMFLFDRMGEIVDNPLIMGIDFEGRTYLFEFVLRLKAIFDQGIKLLLKRSPLLHLHLIPHLIQSLHRTYDFMQRVP